MKVLLITLLASLGSVVYLNRPDNETANAAAKAKLLQYKKKFTVACSPNQALLNPDDNTAPIPLLDGWGNYQMRVTTSNDSANTYFQQGINMYYGFHVIEALASFEKAIGFDSSFAMGYWGKALAYGPNINDFGYTASPDALLAKEKASALSAHCTPVEQALIKAMRVRYSEDSTQTRELLNQQYADAMKQVYEKFADNTDAAVLYADALMQQHPWDLYDAKGKPKTWTPPIVHSIEEALRKNPRHPGAGHYYIHAVEASDHPEKGLEVARQLSNLMPGVAHVVHMPAHIFIRSGFYNEGVTVDEKAVKNYYDYLAKYPPVAGNAALYLLHNLHMQATCANMDGRYADAMKVSLDCRTSFDTSWLSIPDYLGVFIQYYYMTPLLTQIRFGKWNELLQEPAIPANYVYANFLWHYGRGLAFARKHQISEAKQELANVQEGIKQPQLQAPAPSYANPGINGARVAEKILMGILEEEQNNLPAAIALLKQSVTLEDSMIYNEPKDWVHPARQYLGSVLLKHKEYTAAEKIFLEDLVINPNNGWSLYGLSAAYAKGGNKTAAATTKARAVKAFARSDIRTPQPVY